MGYIKIETPPAAEPVKLADMLAILKQPANSPDQSYVQGLIQAARELVEGFTGRSLVNKGYKQVLDSFPYFIDSMVAQTSGQQSSQSLPRYASTMWNYSQMIKLVRAPLRSVTKIVYVDAATSNSLSLFPALPPWVALTEFFLGSQIVDANGNLQVVTAVTEGDEDKTSISGAAAPTWATGVGQTTTDSMLTWTCSGAAPAAGFQVDADQDPPRLFPLAGGVWPAVLYVPNAVTIHFIAGYGNDGGSVPFTLKTAMQQLVTDWYFNREPVVAGAVSELPNHVKALLWNERIYDLAPTRG